MHTGYKIDTEPEGSRCTAIKATARAPSTQRIGLVLKGIDFLELKMSTEELRQNVFSSIHMSTLMKTVQANITYPSCTFCGGMLTGTSSKGSSKRKTALCQLALYTNSSESFIAWFKKQEEPKGMLWMRTCCVRKGTDAGNTVELISRGCRGRCSYTLKFSTNLVSDEWYRLLKQESRKIPSLGDELSSTLMEEDYQASLDYMLTDISPLSVLNEVLHGTNSEEDTSIENETSDQVAPLNPTSPTSSPKLKSKTPKTKLVKHKRKSSPVICNPLQGLSSKSKKVSSLIPISSSFTNTDVNSVNSMESIENNQDADYFSRWSWPMKV